MGKVMVDPYFTSALRPNHPGLLLNVTGVNLLELRYGDSGVS